MTLITVQQPIFILSKTGSNLDKNNIIFTIKKLIKEFWDKFEYLFHEPQKTGRPKTYSKKELLGLTIACHEREIRTCRKIEKAVKNNDESLNYILNNKKPSKSTISKFKNENELLISEFFYFTVKKGQELNLISNEVIGIDGTFLKANAGINNRASRKEIKLLEKTIQTLDFKNQKNSLQKDLKNYFENKIKTSEISKILKKLNNPAKKLLEQSTISKKNKKHILDFLKEIQTYHSSKTNYDINLRDPECRFMNDKKGVYGYNYNYQVATDSKNQMIIYNTVNIQNNDYGQLINMIESSIMSLETKPEFFTADNGYYTDKALEYCFKHDIKIIIPDRTEAERRSDKPKKKYAKCKFIENRVENYFICPEGEKLSFKNYRKINGRLHKIYSTTKCKQCPKLKKCTSSRVKEITEVADPYKEKLKDDYFSDYGQKIYKKRAPITESIFGVLKTGRNYNGLKRLGKRKCIVDLNIEATVHNIKIIHKKK